MCNIDLIHQSKARREHEYIHIKNSFHIQFVHVHTHSIVT
jgi:hypothetical protein